MRRLVFLVTLLVVASVIVPSQAGAPFRIRILEEGTGWPVPLVQLTTVHQVRFVSDNAGVVAFDLLELMGQETWFQVEGHGYGLPKDAYGNHGFRVTPLPGKSVTIRVTRTNLAQRLGRITGTGLLAESQKVAQFKGWKDAGVVGCDSAQSVIHAGRLYWFWGDTSMANYPLGIFDGTGATTPAFPLNGNELKPPIRLHYHYFSDRAGRPRAIAKMGGTGPTWITACANLPDRNGREHLVATYLKIRNWLEAYEKGLCVWNDQAASFEHLQTLWTKTNGTDFKPLPDGHATVWKDLGGKSWMLFGNPFPILRCPATFEAWKDTASWEILPPQAALISADNGLAVKPHSGSIAWHPWKKRWVSIFMEAQGHPSDFGEIWYADADVPTGPWSKATKVLSHNNYTFYNPLVHGEWFNEMSSDLLFEGTYTREFANHAQPTPRYDYNQILYRLDLANLPAGPGINRKF